MSIWKFFKTFLKDKYVGSIIPTSTRCVKKICNQIDFTKDNIIVEYGPGSGVFSKHLLKHMNANSKLILIETNSIFYEHLRQIQDNRCIVINDSAENIQTILQQLGIEKADYIISGIPFSYLKEEIRENIIKKTTYSLSNKGKFLVYQFTKKIEPYIRKYFNNIHYQKYYFNIPFLFTYVATN